MEYQEVLQFTNDKNEFMRYNGIEVTVVKQDYAEVELEVTDKSLNPYGMVHGGAYYTLADCAAGVAARSSGEKFVTLSGSMNFIKSVRCGRLKAIANLLHRGRTTCVVHVEIVEETGKLLTDATFTMFSLQKPFQENTEIKK